MKNRLSRYSLAPSQEKSAPPPGPSKQPTPDRFLTKSQTKAYARLISSAQLAGHRATYAGFRVRTKPLIVGPSGAGKTELIRRLAEGLGVEGKPVPVLVINAGSWIPTCAKAEPSTLGVIRRYLKTTGKRGLAEEKAKGDQAPARKSRILFLDEIDKAAPHGGAVWSDPFSIAIIADLIALLDSDARLRTAGWTTEDIAQLNDCLIVCAGAFQTAFRKAQRKGKDHAEALRDGLNIPEELKSRFNSRYITLTQPDKDDYRAALKRLYSDLNLAASASLLDVVADAAVAADVGMRFLEDHLADLLQKYPELRKPSPVAVPTQPEKRIIPRASFDHELKSVYSLMEQAEIVVALLRTQVQFHASHLFQTPLEDSQEERKLTLPAFRDRCHTLLAGLRIRFARTDEEKQRLHTALWNEAHVVAFFASSHLEANAAYLESHRLVPLFTAVYVRVSRVISAWEYICSLCPDEQPS